MKRVSVKALQRVMKGVIAPQSPVDRRIDGNPLVARIKLQGIARSSINPRNGTESALTWEGQAALSDLVEQIRAENPEFKWGTDYKSLDDFMASLILSDLRGRDASSLNADDASAFTASIEAWLAENSISRTHYIPCALIPDRAAPFRVGSVKFLSLDELLKEHPPTGPFFSATFGQLEKMANERHASWIAQVEVPGCVPRRSAFIGELAVDLALACIQLAVPPHYARNVARVTARAIPSWKGTVSEAGGQLSAGTENLLPGLGLSGGSLTQAIRAIRPLRESVGRRISTFLNQTSPCRTLEQSWCDSAYWYREALAEPIDAIATTKYETAIEVLMMAESTKKSAERIRQAVKAYLGKSESDTVFQGLPMTVSQFTKQIVEVRSRVLHGTFSTLLHDSRLSRTQIHELAKTLLVLSTTQLDQYVATQGAEDDPKVFLKWIESKRAASKATPEVT